MRQVRFNTIFLTIIFGLGSLRLLQADAVGSSFAHPPELEPDIQFWTRVFTEVDTHHGLIHDDRRLDVVYEIISVPKELSRRARNEIVDRTEKHYKNILLKLAEGNRKRLNPEEIRVLKLWPKRVSRSTLKTAASRLRFQLGQADKFKAGWIRSGAWQSHITALLAKQGLPEGLASLPHVESSFNPEAYSHIGAAGLWQFTRATGRRYMRIDHIVDDRLDPYTSSEAAVRLLKTNYALLGTWPLAITAYNHGAAGMRQAVRKLETNNIVTILRRYNSPTFGFASRNFYVAFLAALEADNNAIKYFGKMKRKAAAKTIAIDMPAYLTANTLQKALDLDLATLKTYNAGLRSSIWKGQKLIPKGYVLRVPCKRHCGSLTTNVHKMAATEGFDKQIPDSYYKVRRGDRLADIAVQYRLNIKELIKVNFLRNPNHIRIGQSLRLPTTPVLQPVLLTGNDSKQTRHADRSKPAANGVYSVQVGDTVSQIARRFGIGENWLVAANRLSSKHRIYPGQNLQVVESADSTTTTLAVDTDSITDASSLDLTPARSEDQTTDHQLNVALNQSVSDDDTAPLGPSLPSERHPELSADPSDYSIAEDGTIEVQAAETLGHYADWLQLATQTLRKLNKLRFGKPLLMGKRLKLLFSKVSPASFVKRRTKYHRQLQAAFFKRYQITDTRIHIVKQGESLWALTHRKYNLPMWLLHQYNPDFDFYVVHPGMRLTVPNLTQRSDSNIPSTNSAAPT